MAGNILAIATIIGLVTFGQENDDIYRLTDPLTRSLAEVTVHIIVWYGERRSQFKKAKKEVIDDC